MVYIYTLLFFVAYLVWVVVLFTRKYQVNIGPRVLSSDCCRDASQQLEKNRHAPNNKLHTKQTVFLLFSSCLLHALISVFQYSPCISYALHTDAAKSVPHIFCSLLQAKVQKSWRADLYLWDDARFDCGISIFPSHTTFLSYFPFSLFVRSFVWLKAELSVDFVPTWQELRLAMALCICHNFGVAVLNWEISALNEFLQNRT